MPTSNGHDYRRRRGCDPSFLAMPLLSHALTPPPASPSCPPHPIPPLSFRHLSPCPRWSNWVSAALRDPAFAPLLRSAAISDAVAASTAAVNHDRPALSALLSLWEPASHVFRLPAGPATFSLEDALLLAGLAPSGAPLDRPLTPEEDDLRIRLVVEKEKIKEIHPCARDARRVSAEVWLEWFDCCIRPGEDDELRRLGFLAYWLAFFVTPRLRPKSSELPECAFVLAARLSLGERIALGPAMLANLYADMDRIVASAAGAEGVSGRVDVWAPLWLLQVWLWEHYECLRPPQLRAPQFPVSNARVLHWSRRKRTTTQEEAIRILQDEACFEWRPYLHNSLNWMEPKWFNQENVLVSSRGKDKPEWLEDYIEVIRQRVLTGWYGDGMDNSVMYNPHIVARQFGYDQDVPVPIVHGFESEGTEVWIPSSGRHGVVSKEYVAWCNGRSEKHQEANQSGSSVVAYHENRASSSPLNADKKSVVETAVDQFREGTDQENSKCIGEGQLAPLGDGAQENKTKVIVVGLTACDMNCSATVVKRKKEKKKRRDKFAEDGDKNKRSKIFGSECRECPQFYDYRPSIVSNTEKNSFQFDGQKYSGLQEDPNSDCNKCDPLAQHDSDDECIVLESHDKKCEVINLDDNEKCEVISLDDNEQSTVDPEHHDRQLVLELEEFVRSGLLTQWEESSDEDEGGGRKRETLKNGNSDPFGEAALREYPLFFELIPQKPHYRGLVNNDDALGDLTYSGLWFLLVDLAREVLKTSCDTDASEIAYLLKKALELEQLGFNMKHLIARLKEPQTRLKRLQNSRARLEDARKKEQESKRVQSLSSHLSKLKHNIRTMERHLDENKQAFSSPVHNKLNEGIDLVSLEKEVEAAEKYCQAMKDEVAAMRMNYSDL